MAWEAGVMCELCVCCLRLCCVSLCSCIPFVLHRAFAQVEF